MHDFTHASFYLFSISQSKRVTCIHIASTLEIWFSGFSGVISQIDSNTMAAKGSLNPCFFWPGLDVQFSRFIWCAIFVPSIADLSRLCCTTTHNSVRITPDAIGVIVGRVMCTCACCLKSSREISISLFSDITIQSTRGGFSVHTFQKQSALTAL